MADRIVHFTLDTLPRVVSDPNAPSVLELVVPFRIETDDPKLHLVSRRFTVEIDGRSWSTRARVRQISYGLADWLRGQMETQGRFRFEQLPYYLGFDARLAGGRTAYLEARVPGVPPGAEARYSLDVTLRHDLGTRVASTRSYLTHAVSPGFGRGEIKRIFIPKPGAAQDAWVLYHRRTARADEFRIDLLDLQAEDSGPMLVDLAVRIGDRIIDLRAADPAELPLVDISADSVTFSVPRTGDAFPPVEVTHRRNAPVAVNLAREQNVGKARVMFVNFAIQGLNDLFAGPDDDYDPPRTYTQVTMRDEAASFSSRPGSRENHIGDGYAFTLDAHRRFGIPQLWAMNGGLLGLLAHDCPTDLAQMAQDIANGLLVPVVAGFGAHRLPYYNTATNTDAIEFGARAMRTMLGSADPVYYPDSRLTTNLPNVVDALQANHMEYVVVDGGVHENGLLDPIPKITNPQPPMGDVTAGRWVNWQYLWRDRTSGLKVLFIDREMKDKLLGASPSEADRGKPALELRRKFLELAAQPELRRDNLLVYSDDADKASGNGWFDGTYDGPPNHFNQSYQAALSWIRNHPWVEVVTTRQLGAADCIGDLDLIRTSDPKIESDWDLQLPLAPGMNFKLAFDTWYAAWSRQPAAWLGELLRAVSDRAEQAIADWPAEYRNELYDLARMYFVLNLHESQWSKRPRLRGSIDAENFVIAESLQLRNAHVYLHAAVWAQWTETAADGVAHRDDGPVIKRIAALETARDAKEQQPPRWRRAGAEGLQWDHDPLPNIILYNGDALVVIDRNGGRITHLFSIVDGTPMSISGTCKAYQFLEVDWPSDSGQECDGLVLQNTVWTPNHAYVACDVEPSRGTSGVSPAGDDEFSWYYPDNFNLYDEIQDDAENLDANGGAAGPAVTLEYGDGDPLATAPDSLDQLASRLDFDRTEKVAGRRGVVLHEVATFGRIRKTIRLEGRTVHVTYRNVREGHLVSNEFCVDLWSAVMAGQRQLHSTNGAAAQVINTARVAVRVELGSGCEFSPATRTPLVPATVESLRVHRVMTDDIQVVCPGGGDFDYRIVLP
jgi:hypothetical protein